MRKLLCSLVVLALAGCEDTPAGRPTTAADALWGLAPEGARGGIVMSPYAIAMIEQGSVTLRSFIEKAGPEASQIAEQIDALLAPFGGRKAMLSDLGLSRDKGGALFFVKDGMVAVLPIANRDAFLARAKGTKGATENEVDRIETAVCKTIKAHYACATSEALLATLGKGDLKRKLAKANARGDIEIVGAELPLGGAAPSTIVAVAQLERGTLTMRGILINPPAELVARVGASTRARTAIGRSAGFAVIDLRPMFAGAPPAPIIEGVTLVDVGNTIAGPLTISVPAGEQTLEMEVPLSDPAPLQKLVARCPEVGPLAQVGATVANGVCHIKIPQANLELDLWVDGKTFHVGKQGAQLGGKSIPMPPAAIEIATGQWGFSFWGRGSMLAPTGKPDPIVLDGINPLMTTPIRLMSMVNEAGFAVKKETTKDGDSLRFLATLRTSFANPDAVVAKLVEVTAMDILSNTAATKAQPIADAHRGTPFAGDFAAGQLGLLVPTQLIGTAADSLVPALVRYARGSDVEDPGGPVRIQGDDAPVLPEAGAPGTLTKLFVEKYASDVFPAWAAANPTKPCPASMTELARFVSTDAVVDDEWGKPMVLLCGKELPAGAKGVAIVSGGPDGKLGTADDIKSY